MKNGTEAPAIMMIMIITQIKQPTQNGHEQQQQKHSRRPSTVIAGPADRLTFEGAGARPSAGLGLCC